MSAAAVTAKKWTCDRCGVSAGRMDGERIAVPDAWDSSTEGRFCLICRRERAADAALELMPDDSPIQARAKNRRAAIVEFEVCRTPDHADNTIAKACNSSPSAVAAARQRLHLPAPPPRLPRSGATHRGSASR